MTNKEKFMEVMNQVFNAGFTKDNFDDQEVICPPCGYYKKLEEGCNKFTCNGCRIWWDKEYKEVCEEAHS